MLNVSSLRITGPKILVWDVERSTFEHKARYYDLKQRSLYLKPEGIQKDWVLLGAAWGWLDEDAISVCSVSPDAPLNDYGVVLHLHAALSAADVLVGHNGDNFDFKSFNTRAIHYGLPPVSPKKKIDTLKLARKYFRFTSNKLSYIADFLGVDAKDESPDWDKVLDGCPDEIRYMRKYNKQDVYVTKEVYRKLVSYDETINLNTFRQGVHHVVCKACGSDKMHKNGYDRRTATVKRKYRCGDCGKYSVYSMAELKKIGIIQ